MASCEDCAERSNDAMTNSHHFDESRSVLQSILQVLERIETKIDGHEGRLLQLEGANGGSAPPGGRHGRDAATKVHDGEADVKYPTDGEQRDDEVKCVIRMPYGDWSVDQFISTLPPDIYNEWGSAFTHLDRYYNLTTLSTQLEQRLGCCWGMPDDNRMPLKFFKSNVLKTNMSGGGPTIDTFSKAKQRIERDLSSLCDFDDALRRVPGNDFAVVDFDRSGNSRIYRLGQAAVGAELMVDVNIASHTPWSRIILYQGATTGDSIDPERKRPEQPIPYFTRTDKIIGVWDHLLSHLQLKRRSCMTNPYSSQWTGFHTTFYEIVKTTNPRTKELWPQGPLYEHPLGWNFRKCAFTIYAPAPQEMRSDMHRGQTLHTNNLSRFWTLLILAPNGFFDYDSTVSLPRTENDPGTTMFLDDTIGRLTKPGVELKFIGQALAKISERWADLQAYFDYIVDGGNALMSPADHDNLLFDDGAFSRSRKYFWAIDCLTEFGTSITDNMTQWEQYRAARVDPLIHCLPELDQRQLAYVERQYHVLQNQREMLQKKLASIKALRDALFNASAVIESRASTRLGENVKLLTFMSIFFLPLSFTTSLWSINDTFSRSTLIYVILLVAFTTYLVMFNINALASALGALYHRHKDHVVRTMKRDRSEVWNLRGRRFEVFHPQRENLQPSEWYVLLYAVLHPSAVLGFVGSAAGEGERAKSGWGWGLGGIFRRGKLVEKEVGRTDEGWVL